METRQPTKTLERIIAIAKTPQESEIIKNKVTDLFYKERDNVFIIENNKNIYYSLKSSKIDAFLYEDYIKAMSATVKVSNLREITQRFDWMVKDTFVLCSSNKLSIYSIEKEKVTLHKSAGGVPNIKTSHNGNIFALFTLNHLVFCVNDALERLLDITLDEIIENVAFSTTDEYVLVVSKCDIFVYHLWKGKLIRKFSRQPYQFKSNLLVLEDDKVIYNLIENNEPVKFTADKIFIADNSNMVVEWYLGKIPKAVIKKNGVVFKTKTYFNALDFNCYFYNDIVCTIVTKGESEKQNVNSFIDLFVGDSIIFMPIKNLKVKNIVMNNSLFAITDENNCLTVYKLRNNALLQQFTVKKNGGMLVSVNGSNVVVVYTVYDMNLEFYIDGTIKAAYTNEKCNRLIWSQNALYMAAFSENSNGCNFQIFSKAGELLYNNQFYNCTYFTWRNREYPSNSKIKEILSDNESEIEKLSKGCIIKSTEDYFEATNEWREYLLSKIK